MSDPKTELPQLQDVRQISDGWLKKYVLTYKMPNGTTYEYESISRKGIEEYERELRLEPAEKGTSSPDAVCIVPVLPDGSILLIREFRYAINDWIIAFPAGLVDPGESLESCINRELYEETGYRLRKSETPSVVLLPQSGYSSVGMTDEKVAVAKALVEPAEDQHLDGEELIEIFTLPHDKIGEFLDTNTCPIGTRCQLVLESIRDDGAF